MLGERPAGLLGDHRAGAAGHQTMVMQRRVLVVGGNIALLLIGRSSVLEAQRLQVSAAWITRLGVWAAHSDLTKISKLFCNKINGAIYFTIVLVAKRLGAALAIATGDQRSQRHANCSDHGQTDVQRPLESCVRPERASAVTTK